MNTLVKVAPTWEQVDKALRSIAARRAGLDAEEAGWLRDAVELEIWRPLGMVSIVDYMERVMGYSPHAAEERLRVALALARLPLAEASLARGELSFSAARELTRVATPETEQEWVEAARGKNLRQIEDLVSGHRRGDRPSDPGDAEIRPRVLRLELQPETYAALRQARAVLQDEHGGHLDDNQLVAALVAEVLGGRRERAQHQIATVIANGASRVGGTAQARAFPSELPQSSLQSAMPSTSERSMRACRRERTKMFHRPSHAWCGRAIVVGAECLDAGRRARSTSTTSNGAPTAADMIHRTSSSSARAATPRTTMAGSP